MPLNKDDCRLMTDKLISLYNRLEAQFQQVEQHLHKLWADPNMGKLRQRLGDIAELMRRKFYRVGFLGPSQIGKSTTFNNVLGVPQTEGPAAQGSGAAATASVTRLHAIPPGQQPTCRLRYFSRTEFQERRNDLCKLVGLNVFPEDKGKDHNTLVRENNELLKELEGRLRKTTTPTARGTTPAPGAEEDKDQRAVSNFFARLLRSYQEFGAAKIKDIAHEEVGDYNKRREYTNHPPTGDTGTPYLLLREVEIGFPTKAISETLEMIDLPGLEPRSEADDLLTKAYVRHLSGALVFQSSQNVDTKLAFDLLRMLRRQFGGMEGRVWMVVTRFDSLGEAALHGDPANKMTILDNLAKTLDDNGIPHEQVLLAGNGFYEAIQQAGGKPDAGMYKHKLNLAVDPQGNPIPPAEFSKQERLLQAFKEVIKDGGIATLRAMIGETLAAKVQEQVRDEVRRAIGQLAKDLENQISYAKERTQMGYEDFVNALLWEQEIRKVPDLLEEERLLEPPARALKKQLHTLFDQICPPNMVLKPAELPGRHGNYTLLLKDQSRLKTKVEMLPAIQKVVKDRVETLVRKANLNELSFHSDGQKRTVLDELGAGLDEDSRNRDWYESEFETFTSFNLFPRKGTLPLSTVEYRRLVGQKINAVVHSVTHAIATKIVQRLDDLRKKLDGIGDRNQGNIDSDASKQTFDTILQALHDLMRDTGYAA